MRVIGTGLLSVDSLKASPDEACMRLEGHSAAEETFLEVGISCGGGAYATGAGGDAATVLGVDG